MIITMLGAIEGNHYKGVKKERRLIYPHPIRCEDAFPSAKSSDVLLTNNEFYAFHCYNHWLHIWDNFLPLLLRTKTLTSTLARQVLLLYYMLHRS